LFVLLAFAVMITGCASMLEDLFDGDVPVEQALSSNSFILPESNGKFLRGKFLVGGAGVQSVQLVDDIDKLNPSVEPIIESTTIPVAIIDIGIVNRLDVQIE